jgi:hypothetical protein
MLEATMMLVTRRSMKGVGGSESRKSDICAYHSGDQGRCRAVPFIVKAVRWPWLEQAGFNDTDLSKELVLEEPGVGA